MKPLWHSCRKGGSRKTVQKMYYGVGTVRNGKIVSVSGRLPGKPVWGCSRCGKSWGKRPGKRKYYRVKDGTDTLSL